jgi:hypothetical protein
VRRAAAIGIVVALVVTTVMASTPAGAGTVGRRLPPADRDSLAQIFDPLLETFGLRTTRAALQNLKTYERDPKGRHLAVYVEPTGEYTDAEYVANYVKVARVFLPRVFDRWKGLTSFDVCQEPLPAEDDQLAPPPLTQILTNRRAAAQIDWDHVTLVQLLRAVRQLERTPDPKQQLTAYFAPRLASQPQLSAATSRADAAAGSYR